MIQSISLFLGESTVLPNSHAEYQLPNVMELRGEPLGVDEDMSVGCHDVISVLMSRDLTLTSCALW